MLNHMGYAKCLKWAKKFYKKIGRVLCPALNEYVIFNNKGFNHLIRKLKRRSRTEQRKRFLLLPFAERIILNPKAKIEYRSQSKKLKIKQGKNKVLQNSIIQEWGFEEVIANLKIKVVIRQINNGQKFFYSIMGDKVKNNKKPSK